MTKSPSPLSEEPSQSVCQSAQLLGSSSSHEKTAIEIASLQRGHECLAQGKLRDAEECYRHALQLNPASIEGCQALAEVFNLQGRLEESATCYRRAIELLSSSSVEAGNSTSQISTPFNSFPVVEVEQLQTLLEQAEAALAAKQWNIVKDRCEQLLQLQPSAKTYKLIGNALQAKGEIEAAVQAYTQALQIQPGWAEVYANLGSLKAQQQQWQAAIDDYQKAIHLKPDFAGAYRNLARIWAQINRPDQARQCWYQAFTLEPQKATPEAHFDLGNQLLEQGDRSAAIACYRHAIEQDPNFAAAYQNLAIALNQPESSSVPAVGRSGLTVTRSDQTIVPLSLQARPQSAEQWVDLGTTYAEQQQWEKARSCYQQALQLDPNQAAAHWNLSEVWQEMQNPIAAAESMYQALSLEPTWANPEEHLALGHRLLSFDRVDLAAACYLRVTQLAPNHADAFYGLGEILARKEQLPDAVAHYRRAIDLDPNQLAYYRSLGQVLIQLKDWPQVQDCYCQLIRLEPINPQNYVALAEAATQQGQFETALQTYRQLVEAQPTFWEAHHKIGDLLTQQQQWDAAIEAFQRSIDLNPQFSWSYNNLGDALLHLERWQEAAEAFERAISLKSDFHWSHYNLGEACMHLERWDTAVAAYRNALALNPDLPRLQQKLGFALRHQGEAILIEALSCYRRAIEQDPDDAQNYHGAIDLSPDDIELYNKLADALSKQGDVTGAVVFREIANQLQVGSPINPRELMAIPEKKRASLIESLARESLGISELKLAKKLVIPYSQTPLVSIVIPVYNNIDYTYRCLQSLAEWIDPNTAVEVIVVNDCSTDQTRTVLEQIEGLILIENEENSGFIQSCNRGALQAKGQYIYFLNNDTEIQLQSLEYLIATLEADETIGAVGSKLIYPNGMLQEAGGIIWQDGAGWNYGRMQNPFDPKYNYLRPVDYCSAASLLIRHWVFEVLDGFSETFIPAYYEDTDLCFRIRNELGLKVVCQPKSEIVHYEGVSSGTSTASGVKFYQTVNAEKFQQKWQKLLAHDHLPNQGIELVPKAARRHLGDRTILIINPYMLCHDKESGARRLFEIIKLLKTLNYHIIFAPDNGYKEEPYVEQLQNIQVEVLYNQSGYGVPIVEQIKERLSFIDIAWLCFPKIAQQYLPLLREHSAIKIIYDTIDLHYIRMKRAWEMLPLPRDAQQAQAWTEMKALELNLAQQADLTLTVTPIERDILQAQGISNVAVIPNIHYPDLAEHPNFTNRAGLLFIGGYNHPPNVDAVIWLCQAIMPTVWQKIPDMQVTLLGSNPPDEIQSLAQTDSRIVVPGYVKDISPYFLSHRVFVAPLRYGAGMKGKVGQSLEYGLPLVSTSIGVEGMELMTDETALIADRSEEFAQQILRLYTNEELWNRLAENASQAIASYSPESVKSQLAQLMGQLQERE